MTRVILSIGLFASVLSPASVEAQVFGKGARTEFLTGFGFRTFVSVLEMTDPSADGQTGSPVFRRRVAPLNIVYGARPGLSVIAVLPFVDATLTAPSSAAASEIGGDGGLGDAVFLAKWRFYKRDRGRGTFRLAVEGGVKAPTGASDLRDTAGQRLPRPLQRGSGSWDPTMDFSSTYVPSVTGGRWVFAGDIGYTLTTEADVTESVRLMSELVSHWRPSRIRPLAQDLVVKATAASLADHPRLNANLVGDEIRLLEEINVGVAMAVPEGLMVPVVSKADKRDLLTLAKEMRELAKKAREGRLSLDDVTGASFTVTSLAALEIDAFTPIIDPPQVAILGVGRIVEKPAVHDGQVAVRSMMHLSLAFDHRALDGAPAGELLRAIKGRLEDPAWMSRESEAAPIPGV